MARKVEVTQEDIDKGIHYDAENCPLARAFKRAGWIKPFVAWGYVREDGAIGSTVRLPMVANNFYHDFDKYRTVSPFTFEVEDAR